jgi:hypothetical protein
MAEKTRVGKLPGLYTHMARIDAIASNSTGIQTVMKNSHGNQITVTSVSFIPDAAITGNDTNYFTFILQNRSTNGAGTTAVATLAFTSGVNGVAHDEKAITVSGTAANTQVASDAVLAVSKTVAASGLTMPAGIVVITYRVK